MEEGSAVHDREARRLGRGERWSPLPSEPSMARQCLQCEAQTLDQDPRVCGWTCALLSFPSLTGHLVPQACRTQSCL